MTGEEMLKLPMGVNDADAKTIGDYFQRLLEELWLTEEMFSGKRPFGNSGWKYDIAPALIEAKAVKGTLDEDGYVDEVDDDELDRAGCEMIYCAFKVR